MVPISESVAVAERWQSGAERGGAAAAAAAAGCYELLGADYHHIPRSYVMIYLDCLPAPYTVMIILRLRTAVSVRFERLP